MIKLFTLLVLFQIKHFICDYPLQNAYMLGKFKEKDWELPLAAHCGVHALATLLISICVVEFPDALALAGFDFVVHFIMDRIKASPNMLGRYVGLSKYDFQRHATHPAFKLSEKDFKNNTKFWWALGLDQGVHHLTHYAIIGLLLLWV